MSISHHIDICFGQALQAKTLPATTAQEQQQGKQRSNQCHLNVFDQLILQLSLLLGTISNFNKQTYQYRKTAVKIAHLVTLATVSGHNDSVNELNQTRQI